MRRGPSPGYGGSAPGSVRGRIRRRPRAGYDPRAGIADRPGHPAGEERVVTLIWFIVWLIADNVGGHEPLIFDPVNIWAGFLLLAVALDLAAAHATNGARRR